MFPNLAVHFLVSFCFPDSTILCSLCFSCPLSDFCTLAVGCLFSSTPHTTFLPGVQATCPPAHRGHFPSWCPSYLFTSPQTTFLLGVQATCLRNLDLSQVELLTGEAKFTGPHKVELCSVLSAACDQASCSGKWVFSPLQVLLLSTTVCSVRYFQIIALL